jgi:hypothetical protein
MYTGMSVLRNRDFQDLTDEEQQLVIESRALMGFAITGSIPGVCRFCGAMFASGRSAERHMSTSKRCLASRRTKPLELQHPHSRDAR